MKGIFNNIVLRPNGVKKIENGVSPVLLQEIVKSLIRFEREMVIEFTDNTWC